MGESIKTWRSERAGLVHAVGKALARRTVVIEKRCAGRWRPNLELPTTVGGIFCRNHRLKSHLEVGPCWGVLPTLPGPPAGLANCAYPAGSSGLNDPSCSDWTHGLVCSAMRFDPGLGRFS
jgi:hypothetical protein